MRKNIQLLSKKQGKRMKNVRATVTDEIPPFGRNDSPIGALKE
ncbi:hypothetical protein [Viscerimonas tarda]